MDCGEAVGDPPLCLLCPNETCRGMSRVTSRYYGTCQGLNFVAVLHCNHCTNNHFCCSACFKEKKQTIAYTAAKMWRHSRDVHLITSKQYFEKKVQLIINENNNNVHSISQTSTMNTNTDIPSGSTLTNSTIVSSISKSLLRYHHQLRSSTSSSPPNSVSLTQSQTALLSARLLNSDFFQYYHIGQSIRYLCAKALHNNVNFLDHISQAQAKYHVCMAKSYYEMTETVRANHFKGKEMESIMMNCINSSVVSSSDDSKVLSSGVLYTLKEVNAHYLKQKNSIVMSLPLPKIEIIDQHAYVPIVSAIQYLMAFAPEVDFICKDLILSQEPSTEVHSMWQSLKGIEMANLAIEVDGSDDVIFLYVILWGDDFEGNNCKRGRNSAHIRTLSLSPPNGNNTNDNTVMISLGHKHWSHELVDKRIWEDLETLQKQSTEFYHGGLKMAVKSVILHACNLLDTPERRAANGIISAAGTFGNIIDHVIDLKGCRKTLPSCDKCLRRRMNLQPRVQCGTCTDWDITNTKCNAVVKFPSNENARKKEVDNFRKHHDEVGIYSYDRRSDSIMVPTRKRTFEVLQDAAKQGYKRLCLKQWSRGGTKQYLATAGIPEKISDRICSAAVTQRLTIISNGSSLEESNVDLSEVPLAPVWQNSVSPLSASIPVPMHLWCHGITSTCFENIGMWLTTIKLKATMSRKVSSKLAVVKKLSLEKFKAMEVGVANTDFSTAGYEGENYRCMALLFRWLFAELRDKVSLDRSNAQYKARRKQLQHAENLIELLLCTICRVFKTPIITGIDPEDMSRHCKLLLSALTNLQRSFLDEDAALSFHKAANFGALIASVSDTMRVYPPYRTLWEGGPKGEGFLRSVKRHKIRPSSKSVGWTKAWMERVYRYDVFRRIGIITDEEESMGIENGNESCAQVSTDNRLVSEGTLQETKGCNRSDTIENILGRHKQFCSYREKEWNETLEKHRPISAVLLDNNKIAVIRRLGRELNKSVVGATVSFKDHEGKHVLGGWYAPLILEIHEAKNQSLLAPSDLENCVEILLLPHAEMKDEPRDPTTGYYGISGDWRERNSLNEWTVPQFSKATYP